MGGCETGVVGHPLKPVGVFLPVQYLWSSWMVLTVISHWRVCLVISALCLGGWQAPVRKEKDAWRAGQQAERDTSKAGVFS